MADRPRALIVGASSVLARSLARQYAADDFDLVLAGRDGDEIARTAADIAIRYASRVDVVHFDAASPASVDAAANSVLEMGLPNDIVFVLGSAEAVELAPVDPALADRLLAANYSSIVRFMAHLLPAIEAAAGMHVAFVGSVAGDRGRRGNFVYGAAKAALNAYAQGLRARLRPLGTSVLTVKLGYVDTRLAFGLAPRFMTCSPDYAARAIRRSLARRRMVIYVPWFWRWIMGLLRLLPEPLFVRLPLP